MNGIIELKNKYNNTFLEVFIMKKLNKNSKNLTVQSFSCSCRSCECDKSHSGGGAATSTGSTK